MPDAVDPAAVGRRTLAIALVLERVLGEFEAAAAEAGLAVHPLDRGRPQPAVELSRSADVVWRAPGGFLAEVVAAGGLVRLASATPAWFAGLPAEVTGRRLTLLPAHEAVATMGSRPAMVKLADDKHPDFSASWVRDGDALRDRVQRAGIPLDTPMLLADRWLELDSEYRVFCAGRVPVAWSPYLVEGEAWSPTLHTSRASWHDEAAAYCESFLVSLPERDVPPAAVLDVGRTPEGRFVLLETNNPWSSGTYSCAASGVLVSVLAANEPGAAGADQRWLWRPRLLRR